MTGQPALKAADVLLVEDDAGDVLLVTEAFARYYRVHDTLHVVGDGEDIVRSYSLHAHAYVTKPVDFERFSEAVRQINDFFLTLVKLPN